MSNTKVFETAIKRNENSIKKIESLIAKYQKKIEVLQAENTQLKEYFEKK